MFKRILKVIGFVLLGFVVVIGTVIGFMAIRGDFKKQSDEEENIRKCSFISKGWWNISI